MYRYTTPTIPITIADVDFSDVETFRIVMENGKNELLFVVEANDERVDSTTNTITLELTQEQTALFAAGWVKVQARVLFQSGAVQATEIATLSVKDVLDEVVL